MRENMGNLSGSTIAVILDNSSYRLLKTNSLFLECFIKAWSISNKKIKLYLQIEYCIFAPNHHLLQFPSVPELIGDLTHLNEKKM